MASLLLWIPLATAVEKFSGDRERGKLSKMGKKWEWRGGERKLVSTRLYFNQKTGVERAVKLELYWASRSQTQRPPAQQPRRSHSISSCTAHWQSTTTCAHGRSSVYPGKHCEDTLTGRHAGSYTHACFSSMQPPLPHPAQQMSESFPHRRFPNPGIKLSNLQLNQVCMD